MLRNAVLALPALVAGCGMKIDVIDCIDINGSCSDPPYITRPSLGDIEIPAGVAVDGLWIGSIDGEEIEVVGSLEPSEDQQRLGVSAYPLAGIELLPFEMPFLADPAPFAIHAGAVVRIVVQLRDAERRRLVDQALTFAPPAGLPVQRELWDSYSLAALGDLTIEVVAAERAWPVALPVAPVIDDIVAIPVFADLDALPAVGSELTVCFAAMAGDLRVAGLEWSFAGDGISPPSSTPPTGGCIVLDQAREGATITVAAGGIERTFTAHLAP
jgi:hypothetical protein